MKRAYHKAIAAWWVLLLIIGYSLFAWRFLGTSCVFASTTGLPCPGCGGTRAFVALLRGDFLGSLRYHPLLIPSVVIMCAYTVLRLIYEKEPRFMKKILVALSTSLIILYIIRMLFMFPHDSPMVYNSRAVMPRIIHIFFN